MVPPLPSDALPPNTVVSLATFLDPRPDVRHGDEAHGRTSSGIPTGFAVLDEALGGGWPARAITELLVAAGGVGELSLLLPALRRLTGEADGRVAIVGAPFLPCAPALHEAGITLDHLLVIETDGDADTLWAVERLLGSGGLGAVLAWVQRTSPAHQRRLQRAAERGGTLGFVYRDARDADAPSPVALRLRLEVADGAFAVDILHHRAGGGPGRVAFDPGAFDQAQGLGWPVPMPPARGGAGASVTPLFGPE